MVGVKGAESQCSAGPGGTTSVWPAKANTGPSLPSRAQKLLTSPKGRDSIVKPSACRRANSSSWQPPSDGVIEAFSMRAAASARVSVMSVMCGVSVMRVQSFVECDGGSVGLALHCAGDGVAAEQQVGLTHQFPCLDGADHLAVLVQQQHLGAGCHIQPGLDDATIPQRNAEAGVGTDQAVASQGDELGATPGQRPHGAATPAQIAAGADRHACGNASFYHRRAFCTGIE